MRREAPAIAAVIAIALPGAGCDPAAPPHAGLGPGAAAPPPGASWSAPPPGAPGASSGSPIERFFPLVDGHVYQYATTNDAGERGVIVARVRRESAGVGELRLPSGSKRFAYTPEGVILEGRGAFVLREPLAVGASWPGEHGGLTRVVAAAVSAEVPAGRFAGCVQTLEERLGDRPLRYLSTFCPDVGLVALEASGGASYERAELRSYGPPVQIGPDGLTRTPVTPPP